MHIRTYIYTHTYTVTVYERYHINLSIWVIFTEKRPSRFQLFSFSKCVRRASGWFFIPIFLMRAGCSSTRPATDTEATVATTNSGRWPTWSVPGMQHNPKSSVKRPMWGSVQAVFLVANLLIFLGKLPMSDRVMVCYCDTACVLAPPPPMMVPEKNNCEALPGYYNLKWCKVMSTIIKLC